MATVTKRLNKNRQQSHSGQFTDSASQPEPVKSRTKMKVVCPASERHEGAKIWRTAGRIRYCKCNTCGATWKQIDDKATDELPTGSVDCQQCGKPAVEYQSKNSNDRLVFYKCNHCGHDWKTRRTLEQ